MQIIELEKLDKIIEKCSQTAVEQMLYRDMFAMACYLSFNGKIVAAQKLCRTLFEHLGFERRKTYFISIMDTLQGNELRYLQYIEAHSEISDIFEQ